MLIEMAATVGAAAIQNRGTVGGSLGNASPASDPAPVLLALDATVELARTGWSAHRVVRRSIPCSSFFLSYRKTAAEPGGADHGDRDSGSGARWLALRLPQSRHPPRAGDLQGRRRRGLPAPPRRAETTGRFRVAFGSVAATPVRAPEAENPARRPVRSTPRARAPPPRRSSSATSGRSTTCARPPPIARSSPGGSSRRCWASSANSPQPLCSKADPPVPAGGPPAPLGTRERIADLFRLR